MALDPWTFPENRLKKIPPLSYMHILNTNTSVVSMLVGPLTYMCKDEEKAIFGPAKMIVIPPRHSLVVQNPVLRVKDNDGNEKVQFDKFGQAILKHGDSEVRLSQDPFPLYPGEVASARIEPLQVLEPFTALRIQAIRDFHDRYMNDKNGNPVFRQAGEQWLVYGPVTFIPQVEQRVICEVRPTLVKPGDALHLRATRDFTDRKGTKRVVGEEWLYTDTGSFLPEIEEEIVGTTRPHVLTDKIALRVFAKSTFVDCFNVLRKPGEEWLVTRKDVDSFLPDVRSQVVATESVKTLAKREWAFLFNPHKDGKPQYGYDRQIRGEKVFFLNPGEYIGGVQTVHVLTATDALMVQALVDFEDDSTGKKIKRIAGEKWIVPGPREFWQREEISVVNKLTAFLSVGNFNLFDKDYFIDAAKMGMIAFVVLVSFVLWLWLVSKY